MLVEQTFSRPILRLMGLPLALTAMSLAPHAARAEEPACLDLQALETGMQERNELRRTYLRDIRIDGGGPVSLAYRHAMLRLNFYAGTAPVREQMRVAHTEQDGCETIRVVQTNALPNGTTITQTETFEITSSSPTRLEMRKVSGTGTFGTGESFTQTFELVTENGVRRLVKTAVFENTPYQFSCPSEYRREVHDVTVVNVTEWGATLSDEIAFSPSMIELFSNATLRPEAGMDPRRFEYALACGQSSNQTAAPERPADTPAEKSGDRAPAKRGD